MTWTDCDDYEQSLADHHALWDEPVTLDGEPAAIVNRNADYPSVVRLDNGLGCEFAPSVIDRIIDLRNGAFKS